MKVDELERLFRDFRETLSDAKDEYWTSDYDFSESLFNFFLNWYKENVVDTTSIIENDRNQFFLKKSNEIFSRIENKYQSADEKRMIKFVKSIFYQKNDEINKIEEAKKLLEENGFSVVEKTYFL